MKHAVAHDGFLALSASSVRVHGQSFLRCHRRFRGLVVVEDSLFESQRLWQNQRILCFSQIREIFVIRQNLDVFICFGLSEC